MYRDLINSLVEFILHNKYLSQIKNGDWHNYEMSCDPSTNIAKSLKSEQGLTQITRSSQNN